MKTTLKNLYGMISIFLVTGLFSAGYAQQYDENNPPPDFPPDDFNRTMDRDQMLYQLGIKFPILPPKLEDPNAPPNTWPVDSTNPEGNWTDDAGHTITRSGFGLWNNYDDTEAGFFPGPESWRVGEYTPINLLKMHNGTIITTPEQWWNERRPEILKDVQEEYWGKIPPDDILPTVSWQVTTTTGVRNDIPYIQKAITGNIDISRYPEVKHVPKITATLRVPANAESCVPVLIVFNWGGIFGSFLNTYWDRVQPAGWGACEFLVNDLQPDFVIEFFPSFAIKTGGDYLNSYLIGLVNHGNWRSPEQWGTLAAWSWGISRLIDYFETDLEVDATQIGVTGNSRFGKATLVAMAYDERIAIGFASESGSLGAKMNRRHWGQDAENSAWDQEYHWMSGNFFKYMGLLDPDQPSIVPRKIELCPVDAHSLLSLCAPRPFFINGGTQDSWVDPYGMYLTTVGATPVYELLGKQGIIMNDPKPQVDVGYIEGDLAYRYHEGGHTDAPDFPDFMLFASKYIKPASKPLISLWPPNHEYETIKLSDFGNSIPYTCACLANGVITKVTSDEPEDSGGGGDGHTKYDIVIADDFKSVKLRQEREGTGNGRVYTIYLAVPDAAGNVGRDTIQVQVPHDQNSTAMDDGPVYEVLGADLSSVLSKANNASAQAEIITADNGNIPTEFDLKQNYPNPFNPTTTIGFAIPEAGYYTLKIYNTLGQEYFDLVNKQLEPGFYSLNFDASKLASGTYIYTLKGKNVHISKKMILVR